MRGRDNYWVEQMRRITYRSPAERAAAGHEARRQAPRRSHAAFGPWPDRPDPVALLEQQAAARIPDLVRMWYERMLISPFSYFVGAALPMASDLSHTPASGLIVQACGDAHLANFSLFGSPERRVLFDLDAFDETLPAPWEWDVKRLAASLEIAARQNEFDHGENRKIVLHAARAYRQAMRFFADMGNLEIWYARVDARRLRAALTSHLDPQADTRSDRRNAIARMAKGARALVGLTQGPASMPRIAADPPLVMPLRDLLIGSRHQVTANAKVAELLARYRHTLDSNWRALLDQYEVVDIARKDIGVGGVASRSWIVLLAGRDHKDPLFLQVKEARESVLAPYAGESRHRHQGERVVAGQRMMQAASDIFLGWDWSRFELDGNGSDAKQHDFYVRQLRDRKAAVDIAAMDPRGMQLYGEICAWTLAKAHARSGDRIAIAGYLGHCDVFDKAIAEFAVAYADQNERDHRALREAVGSGRVKVADR